MGLFGRSKIASKSGGTFGQFTRTINLDGRCGCGASVSTTGTVTTVLGEMGTAVADVAHSCGRTVTVSGDY